MYTSFEPECSEWALNNKNILEDLPQYRPQLKRLTTQIFCEDGGS